MPKSPALQPAPPPVMRTIRSADALVAHGLIAAEAGEATARVGARYAIALTPTVAGLIDATDPQDPIAVQFLPDARELDTTPDELTDPIGDAAHEAAPGVIHRYPDRALLKIIHACPVYCRFCFRREMVGPGGAALTGDRLEAALAYIAATPAIREIIMTGGDPFMLPAKRVAALMDAFADIAHVRIVRWHTRVPMVDPARVTAAFTRALMVGDKAVYVGVHANHPREFTPQARAALKRLNAAGAVLLSQSVLLKGVNADAKTLAALMRAFVENRVMPYYLHHPDLAPGTAHFRLSIAEGQALVAALRGHLSGLAQPAYVLDIPGGFGKIPIGPGFLEAQPDGSHLAIDRAGRRHRYPPPITT